MSKFSKVSLFSGFNNLTDITLEPRYSAICGYTEADLDTVFTPEMPGLDRDEIRDWYNGYGWRGQDRVYARLVTVGRVQRGKLRIGQHAAKDRLIARFRHEAAPLKAE